MKRLQPRPDLIPWKSKKENAHRTKRNWTFPTCKNLERIVLALTAFTFFLQISSNKMSYSFRVKDQHSENWYISLPSVRKSIIGTYSNSHHVFVTNRTIISILFLTPFLDSKDGKFFYDLENDPTNKRSTGYEPKPKKVKFWLQEQFFSYLKSSHAMGNTSIKAWSESMHALLLRTERGTWKRLRMRILKYFKIGGGLPGPPFLVPPTRRLDLAHSSAKSCSFCLSCNFCWNCCSCKCWLEWGLVDPRSSS